MLTEQKLKSLKGLVQESSRDEIIWMSGFLAGLSDNNKTGIVPPAEQLLSSPAEKLTITVLYGTETGNSKKIATQLGATLKKQGHKIKLSGLDQYAVSNLANEKIVLLVISTHGDGEPPAAAKKFYDFIHSENIKLEQLKYAVLALGDSSYPLFCKAGEDIDKRLFQSGAKQIIPLQKADTDYNTVAEEWINNVQKHLSSTSGQSVIAPVSAKPSSGKKFYKGRIAKHINLNDNASSKKTYHIEIQSDDEIHYQPGDALGIIPVNTDEDVALIISLLNAKAETKFLFRDKQDSLFNLLKYKINILHLPQRIVKAYATLIKTELPDVRLDLKDMLSLYPLPANINAEAVINILEPITPRLYSISSSPSAHGANEVHITIGLNTFSINQKTKYGFCSSYAETFELNDEIEFYIQPNNNFRLPDADKDIIMIGPGTGIAPFRSFLFERDSEAHTGRNWLFFGDRNFATDFLYQSELLSFFDTGHLTKLNTAFSRDHQEKLYVQHRMIQQSAQLYEWLEGGAHLYICGCKNPMALDVEEALIKIISKEAGVDNEAAKAYLQKLSDEGRFAKDVY